MITPLSINSSEKMPKAAFGALRVAQLAPYINVSAIKGLSERILETYTNGTGSFASIYDNLPGRVFKVSSGTSVGGYGVLRSKKVLEYKSGTGNMARFTAVFSNPATLSSMRVGLNNIGNELAFGYNGTSFGILKRTGGRPEIRTLTISARATSAQNVTIVLNGATGVVIALTNSTIQQNAYEIAQGAYPGWVAYNVDSTVIFQAQSTGAKSGSYSETSAGDFAGSFAQTAQGLTETDEWIPQASWNRDTLDSLSPSFVLNPQKGNVFQIQYQYLGFGAINFFVENPKTGEFVLVHQIEYANSAVTPSLDNPNFKVGLIAVSLGSTTDISVSSASFAAFSENALSFPAKTHSLPATASGIGTTATNVLAFKKITTSDNVLNITDVRILSLTFAVEGNNPAILELRLNPVFSSVMKWSRPDEDTCMISATDNNTFANGELIYSVALSKSGDAQIDLTPFDLNLSNDDVLALCVRSTAATTAATVSLTWSES